MKKIFLLGLLMAQLAWAQNPIALSVIADDPDDYDSYESIFDIVTISFDIPTNQPIANTKVQIDALMTFSVSLGSNYTGSWTNNQTLVITIQNNGANGNPTPGVTTVSFNTGVGGIKNLAATQPVLAGPVTLNGDWGLGSPLAFFGGVGAGDVDLNFNNPLTCKSFFGGLNSGDDNITFTNPTTCISFFGGIKSGDTIGFYDNPLNCSSFFGGIRSGDTSAVYVNPYSCISFFSGQGDGYDTTVYLNPFTCPNYSGSSSSGDDVGATASICAMYFGSIGDGDISGTFNNPYKCPNYFAGLTDGFAADSSGCVPIALPIVSSPLFAEWDGLKARVFWKTFYQENFSHYEVQKSPDGSNWKKMSVLSPQQGNAPWDYFTYDENPFAGITYYRFIAHDLDGKTAFSNVASLQLTPNNHDLISIYPNPLSDSELQSTITTQNESLMTLTVMNSVGQIVYTDNKKLEVGTNKLTWNLETCTKGIYLLNFQWANVNQTIRLIKN